MLDKRSFLENQLAALTLVLRKSFNVSWKSKAVLVNCHIYFSSSNREILAKLFFDSGQLLIRLKQLH